MKKQNEFSSAKDIQLDKKIEDTMNREFQLPEQVEAAKQKAFDSIRSSQFQREEEYDNARRARNFGRRKGFFAKTAGGMVAAAAAFSLVCISNPALAQQIPLIGHVFEELGGSIGFSGDYSKYASALKEDTSGNTAEDGETEDTAAAENGEAGSTDAAESSEAGGTDTAEGSEAGNTDAAEGSEAGNTDAAEGSEAGSIAAVENNEAEDSAVTAENDAAGGNTSTAEYVSTADRTYSKTVDGVTITLSEVYCNDVALYLSMLIQTEEKFPETLTNQQGAPSISLYNSVYTTSFNPEEHLIAKHLDGRMIDEHTYAGVLRIDRESMQYSFDDQYYEDVNTFFESLGVTKEEMEEDPKTAYDKIEELLGIELLSDDVLAEKGGPDAMDYRTVCEIPKEFTLSLNIDRIIGNLPESSLPDMPQELKDEYDAAMAEHGLDPANYENFTEEEKDIELELFNEMHNKYAELYPEAAQYPNKYENWWLDGAWDFEVPVTGNHEDTIVKEIWDTDENGLGIATVTKTPVEIAVESILPVPAYDYFTVAVDANGDILPYGSSRTNAWAIQDRDVSKIDIYICDYIEYMDELKGYYFSDSYEENKKTKTFKELLDERALHHTEVVF